MSIQIKLTIVLLLFQIELSSQAFILKGTVKGQGVPLPHSTIEIISKGKGAIADTQGEFTIELEKKDTLLIQSLGYKSKFVYNVSTENIQINLEADTFLLNTVTVSPHDLKNYSGGFIENKPKGGYRSQAGSFIAYHILNKPHLGDRQTLRNVSIYIANEAVVATPIRVRCMTVQNENGMPGKDLYKDPIVLIPYKGGKWYNIDLSKMKVAIPEEGVFICFEYFEDKPEYYHESSIKSISGVKRNYQSYGNTLGAYWSAEPSLTWHKNIGNKWFQRLQKIEGKIMNLAIKYTINY
jgi:hypothetical protein